MWFMEATAASAHYGGCSARHRERKLSRCFRLLSCHPKVAGMHGLHTQPVCARQLTTFKRVCWSCTVCPASSQMCDILTAGMCRLQTGLQEALTLQPPHVILLPHPSFDFVKLSSLIERLEVRCAALLVSLVLISPVNVMMYHTVFTKQIR